MGCPPADQDRGGPSQPANDRLGRPRGGGGRRRPLGGNRVVGGRPRLGGCTCFGDGARLGRRALADCVCLHARPRARRGRGRGAPTALGSRPRPAGRGARAVRRRPDSGWRRRIELDPDRSAPAVAVGIPRAQARRRHCDLRGRRARARPPGAPGRGLARSHGGARCGRVLRGAALCGAGRSRAGPRGRRDRPPGLRDRSRRTADGGREKRSRRARRPLSRPETRCGSADRLGRLRGPRRRRASAAGARARSRCAGHAMVCAALAVVRLPRSTEKRRNRPARAGRARSARHDAGRSGRSPRARGRHGCPGRRRGRDRGHPAA